MLFILSLVTRSEIMTAAHCMVQSDLALGRQLAYNANKAKWCKATQYAWQSFQPITFAEALRDAWRWARTEAANRKMEALKTVEVIRLHEIEVQKLALGMKERWNSADYAQSHSLQLAFLQARTAAFASIGVSQ
jgi:hypothetical protein